MVVGENVVGKSEEDVLVIDVEEMIAGENVVPVLAHAHQEGIGVTLAIDVGGIIVEVIVDLRGDVILVIGAEGMIVEVIVDLREVGAATDVGGMIVEVIVDHPEEIDVEDVEGMIVEMTVASRDQDM